MGRSLVVGALVLVALGATARAAGATEEEALTPAPAPVATPAPEEAEKKEAFTETSKDAGSQLRDKIPLRAKIKECCGYPLSLPGDFRLSFYWLAWESDYALEPYDTSIYTRDGFLIGRYPVGFVFELKLEGSGVLLDGRVLNYDGLCNYGMGTCFRTVDPKDHPLGAGVQQRPLEPFRSIAVDPRYIPIGSPVYVPELVGIVLPDGTRHDGCLRADDQGGAIKLHKLDFFVESYKNFKFIADNLWWKLKATPHLEEPRCEYLRLHFERERTNDHTDYLVLRHGGGKLHQAAKASLKKTQRERQKALAWTRKHSAAPVAPAPRRGGR